MKNVFLIVLLSVNCVLAQDNSYHYPNFDLKIGGQYFLFGDNVKFRTAPDTNSEVIALLTIGSSVEIIEKSNKILSYNGMDSPFYKVSHKGKTGYILGGLISLEKQEYEDYTYLFTFKKIDFIHHLLVRSMAKNGTYTEAETGLGDTQLFIQVSDNKGLNGVQNIVHIVNHPEACGVVGGDIYFFETADGLKKAINTTIFSEAGINWYNEKLVFPTDENGILNRILYKEERGENGDEATNEIHISTVIRELRWENGELLPKIGE